LVRHTAQFLGAAFFLSLLVVSVIRGGEEAVTLFRWAPHTTLEPTFLAQIDEFKARVPAHSTVVFVSDRSNGWQTGLWQRTLYATYDIYPDTARNPAEVQRAIQAISRQAPVHFVLSAGTPPPAIPGDWSEPLLPTPPGALPTVLVRLPR
jgi:hypothetical protein